ncbi:MAG: two-component system response regulator [Bacteroidetes bacterium MED-G21]|nr:MAG: two-component system response regulator [Bacteroidetes bacterium MED-G21]
MNFNSRNTNILYIDDDIMMLENFKLQFKNYFSVQITDSISQAKKIIENEEIHIIICDQRMEETTGVEFFTEIIKKKPNPIRILLTAFTDVDVIIDAINYGHIYQYIRKPFVYTDMLSVLFNASKIYHLKRQKNTSK